MTDKVDVKVKLKFRTDTLVRGRHTFIIPFDDGCAERIGEIVIYWGAFEVRMDALITHIFQVSGKNPNPKWRKLPFGERKKLFRKVIDEYTALMFPHMTAKFDEIMNMADILQTKRNIVAHGYYEILPGEKNSDGEVTPRIVATGDAQKGSIEINTQTVNQLWHDISHLVGELLACVNQMGGHLSGTDIVIADDDFMGLPETEEPKPLQIRTLDLSKKTP